MSENDVLYEVKELHQWKLDVEPVNSLESDPKRRFLQKFNIRQLLPEKNKDVSNYYHSQLLWQFAVSNQDRTLIAILQENFLEIRHKRDDYKKPVGITSIPQDEHPQWRKLTWSSDGIYLAFSTSCGELRFYNTLTTLVCSIPKVENNYDATSMRPNGAISALLILEVRTKSAEWPYELIAIDYYGNLRSYFVSSTQGYKPYHTFCFGESVLTSATYISTFNILIIAFPSSTLSQKSAEDTLGLSSWRLLTEYPYYRLVKPNIEDLLLSRKETRFSSLFTSSRRRTVVLKMSISLDVKFLACMHSCGAVSVWNLPQLSLFKLWQLQDLPQYDNPNMKMNSENQKPTLSDINWCLDTKLVLLRNNGTLAVSNIDTLDNLLARINPKCHVIDRRPEFFVPPTRLANVCDMNIGFLVLNHEYKELSSWRRESENSNNFDMEEENEMANSNAVDVIDNHSLIRQILRFFVHFEIFQQRRKLMYVKKTYKLTSLKSVTPAELYEQKINNEEYSEALDFAKLFNLDENGVYKKQWISSCPVTIESIDEYLLKISDKAWIIHECCERIPEILEAAEMLLKKGLEFTDFSEFILDDQLSEYDDADKLYELKDSQNFEFNYDKTTAHFSKNQLHILKLRKHLLWYWDALSVYKKIIDLDPKSMEYDGEVYETFRSQSPLSVALNFAREGNAEAVFVLFTYYKKEILPYWFEVLDNIPECIPPFNYKKLLPKFNEFNKLELWPHKRIRAAEWSESGDFKDLIVLKEFKDYSEDETYLSFSKKEVTEWYEKKIRRVAEESGLINYALELLNLACQNKISGLENLRHNLLVLDKLMYDLLVEEDRSLSEVENYSNFEKLELLMSPSVTRESFKNAISEIFLPFLNRCETLRSNSKDLILDTYMKQLSENDLMLPLTFFEYLNDKDKDHLLFSAKRKLELRLLCVYSCTRVDQIEVALKIIEVKPEFSDNNNSGLEEISNLRSRLTELHTELVIMQVLGSYDIQKTVMFLHRNKNNEKFQKEVFTAMMNLRIDSNTSSQQEIYTLYNDMAFVQDNFFSSLPRQTYLHIFAYSMLTSGRTDYIEEYAPLVLSCSSARKSGEKNNSLSFTETVSTIIEAAQYYFNIATCYEDPNISLATACLSLIAFHPDLERERKLIDALKELCAFGVQISPLKVRMCVDKKRILEKVLKSKPKMYKKVERLVSLAANLETDDKRREDLEIEVLNLAIDTAFQMKDYSWYASVLSTLMENEKPCWELCKKLCLCTEYLDLETKQKLIKYALMHCPDNELMLLIQIRNEVECSALQKKLQNSLQQLQLSANEKTEGGNENNESGTNRRTTYEPEERKKKESPQALISVPALMNMLHTSSSTVLNINFWKNTFKFSFEEGVDEVECISNTECTKLGFPEFYADIHEHKDCISFATQKLEKEKEILQQLLRYYLLSSKDSRNTEQLSATDFNDVIAQLAISSFSNDCLLCLSLLLLFKDLDYSEKVFSSLPNTTVVEKFALYYYSLKFLVDNNIAIHDLVAEQPPAVLVSRALNEAEKVESIYVRLIDKYKKALEKRRSANKLQDLGCGIDSARFFRDETYKLDSVLGLAVYEERDKLDTALSLGAEYGVSTEDIMLSHVKSLFLTGNLTLLTDRLKEPIVVETLKKNPSYVAQKLITDIYDGLAGCDYQRLLLYFALVNQVAQDEIFHHLKSKEHMKLLRKLKSFTKVIDYKLLICDQPRIVEAVMPAILSGETSQVVNFLVSLPPAIKENINMESIFEQLARKLFFNGRADASYTKRFEISLTIMEQLSEEQITDTMQKFLFSKFSYENMNTATRQSVLDMAVKFFLKKNSGEENYFVQNLRNYSHRLAKIDEFNEISSAVDIPEVYLRDLQETLIDGKTAKLKEIILQMVLDISVSVDVIKVIMEFARAGLLTDIITDLLETSSDEKIIDVLLYRIENCLEDNEYDKCWCVQLQSLRERVSRCELYSKRIDAILSILQQLDSEIYNAIELLHETRLILREWVDVHSRISLFDVAKEEARLILIGMLLEKSGSLRHFNCILKLLKFWPRFNKSTFWKEDPWMLLLEKILSLDENEIPHVSVLNLVQSIMHNAQPSKEVRRDFFEYMGSMPHNKIMFVWFCVLTDDDLLIQSVSGYVEDLRQTRKMPKLIEENLRRRGV